MQEYLQSILDMPWKTISRPAIVAWLVFYTAFLGYAFSARGGFLFIDNANLIVHEGGHNLFRWFGPTLGLWGGTLLQWLVPFLLAAYFFTERQTAGFVFAVFFFFENWLYTATYMADARAQQLPLVTTGDPDFIEHDFHAIFTQIGVLNYDTKIALAVRMLGWCGMMACVAWLAMRLRAKDAENSSMAFSKPAISLMQSHPGKASTAAGGRVSNANRAQFAPKSDAGQMMDTAMAVKKKNAESANVSK